MPKIMPEFRPNPKPKVPEKEPKGNLMGGTTHTTGTPLTILATLN